MRIETLAIHAGRGPDPATGALRTPIHLSTTFLAAVRAALARPTRLLWVESPSNPLLRVSDIGALAGLAHEHGAPLACDNTFATPVLQQPPRSAPIS